MRIAALDLADAVTAAACHAVSEDAARADDPYAPPVSVKAFRSRLSSGWTGGAREIWFAPGGEDGTVAGWYGIELPDLENLNRAAVELVVAPERRRAGFGSELLRHAAERAVAGGRDLLRGDVREGSPGEGFALRFGAVLGRADVRRVLDLAKVPAGAISRVMREAAASAAGYSLVRWTGITPDERLDQVATLQNALNDAPRDAGVQPATWDAARVRDRMNARIARSPFRRYSLAAVHERTGEMAALTAMSVDPDTHDWGHQLITAVTKPHRGHRLGLLVKAAMMDWLAETEPQLEHIETWNAGSNAHMIAINEELGYTVRGQYRSAELPAASVALR